MSEADRIFDRFPPFVQEFIYTHSWESLRGLQIAAARTLLDSDHHLLLTSGTASGKTEIYIKLIQEAINEGKQVLYLLPEIALTEQIINRLKKYFGDRVGVYHSRYDNNERVEIWQQVMNFRSSGVQEFRNFLHHFITSSLLTPN